ncbi:MAG: glycosyltransferase family 2 protein [Armatimonadota bacterium]|nr:glycosyltransferase family 2 protein [Armatimonadota bacterium]MDR7443531.1 glycosyltransferase family 2 protein [Armatimonadota bacterium]MDR7570364.1 glycosyltransferase family 2 protein [Armatimonadota bacterium]MDR7615030.1 glycosyltransferase family 2 protein [Armatimonadota bacterium]
MIRTRHPSGSPRTRPAVPDCSVVFLNWNKRDRLRKGLAALRGPSSLRLEVIVVDNGSTDGSAEMVRAEFPEVHLVETGHNLGIARGKNEGIRLARGEFVLVADDDVVIHPEQIHELIRIARENPQAAVVAPMKVDDRGEPLYTHHVPGPSTLGFWHFLVAEWSLQQLARWVKRTLRRRGAAPHENEHLVEVPFIGGGVMLVRRTAIEQVGLLDGNIFFYGEDFDWCWRFRRHGWKVLYAPQVRVVAAYGVNARRTKRASLISLQSRRYLFTKHVGRCWLPLYVAVALVGLGFRLVYYALQDLLRPVPGDIRIGTWLARSLAILFGLFRDPPALPRS